ISLSRKFHTTLPHVCGFSLIILLQSSTEMDFPPGCIILLVLSANIDTASLKSLSELKSTQYSRSPHRSVLNSNSFNFFLNPVGDLTLTSSTLRIPDFSNTGLYLAIAAKVSTLESVESMQYFINF